MDHLCKARMEQNTEKGRINNLCLGINSHMRVFFAQTVFIRSEALSEISLIIEFTEGHG